MARTKMTHRRDAASTIFIPRPQNTLNIADRVRDRQLTDAIAKNARLRIVNKPERPRFKIKKLLLERKAVQIKKKWTGDKKHKRA